MLAARDLFERDGFRATTLAAISARADISVEGIYKTFGSKAALAKAVFDVVVAGDDEPVAVAERPEAAAVHAEPDLHAKIRLFAEGLAQRQARSAKVQILVRDGRHVDASLEPVWAELAEEGLAGMAGLARHLASTSHIRAGLDVDRMRDVLWNYLAIDHYERLVLHRNWTLDAYTQWLTAAITNAIT
ncbi:helix-turn-helix domain-containing protein [Amycolatopsis sp. NPDC051371]|uniref:TetR/AcrR family transcriptional regulator n=1 Tax=Amycolatopsis sp. NPDC051371 TaxID=3155800 RepID=UPI00343485D8